MKVSISQDVSKRAEQLRAIAEVGNLRVKGGDANEAAISEADLANAAQGCDAVTRSVLYSTFAAAQVKSGAERTASVSVDAFNEALRNAVARLEKADTASKSPDGFTDLAEAKRTGSVLPTRLAEYAAIEKQGPDHVTAELRNIFSSQPERKKAVSESDLPAAVEKLAYRALAGYSASQRSYSLLTTANGETYYALQGRKPGVGKVAFVTPGALTIESREDSE